MSAAEQVTGKPAGILARASTRLFLWQRNAHAPGASSPSSRANGLFVRAFAGAPWRGCRPVEPALTAAVSLREVTLALFSGPLLALLWVYRRFVSPALPPSCRYYPSCSHYAEQALRLHGPLRGTWLATLRLLRCHPFCEGGLDPVPPHTPHPRSV